MTTYTLNAAQDISTLGKSGVYFNAGRFVHYGVPRTVDMMKQANPWTMNFTHTMREMVIEGSMSPRGNFLSAPSASGELQCYFYILEKAEAGMAFASGTYRLWHDGGDEPAALRVQGNVTGFARTGARTWEFTLDATAVGNNFIGIEKADINWANPPSGWHLVQTARLADHAAGVIWHPSYVAELSAYSGVRDLNLTKTNSNAVINWEDRTHLTDQFWGGYGIAAATYSPNESTTYDRGVPHEASFDLARLCGGGLEVCLPARGNDGYYSGFANLLRAYMLANNIGTKAIIEYVNEHFNSIFIHYKYSQHQAALLWGPPGWEPANGYNAAIGLDANAHFHWSGKRFAEIIAIMKPILGNFMATVISVQTGGGQSQHEAQMLAQTWAEEDPENYVAPHTLADYVAGSGYFGYPLLRDNAQAIYDAIQISYAAGVAKIIEFVPAQITITKTNMAAVKATADQYGLGYLTYEFNNHMNATSAVPSSGSNPLWITDPSPQPIPALIDVMQLYARSAEAAGFVEETMDYFAELGGTIQTVFTDMDDWPRSGMWGVKNSPGDTTPLDDMIKAWVVANPRNKLI